MNRETPQTTTSRRVWEILLGYGDLWMLVRTDTAGGMVLVLADMNRQSCGQTNLGQWMWGQRLEKAG